MGKMGHSAGRERKPTNKKKQVGKNDEKYRLKEGQNGRGVQFLDKSYGFYFSYSDKQNTLVHWLFNSILVVASLNVSA